MTPKLPSRPMAVALACLALSPTATDLFGQAREKPRPALGGHTFIWNPATKDPFPRTFIRNTTGIGRTRERVLIPAIEIGDIVLNEVRGELLFAELDFTYQHEIRDWLAVWGRFNLGAKLGTTTGSLLAEGITTSTGMELGWLFRLVETRSVMISGTANLWNDGFTDVDILRWAQGLGEPEGAGLVESSPTVRGGGGLRVAWGISEAWGVLASADGGYGESADPTEDSGWVWDLAGGVGLDLSAYTATPIGFVLSGASRAFDREVNRPGLWSHEVALRTAFTGRDDFLIALDGKWSYLATEVEDDVVILRLSLSLQYYF